MTDVGRQPPRCSGSVLSRGETSETIVKRNAFKAILADSDDRLAARRSAESRCRGSPKYFEEHRRSSHPKKLVDRACFGQIFPRGNRLHWLFERSGEEIEITPSGGPIFRAEPDTQLQAAHNGLVLALLLVEHCQGDLKDWCQTFAGPYLYYPERRLIPSPLRAFVDFVKGTRQSLHSCTE